MPRLPGLDGLRGLAVIGAILFHAGFSLKFLLIFPCIYTNCP